MKVHDQLRHGDVLVLVIKLHAVSDHLHGSLQMGAVNIVKPFQRRRVLLLIGRSGVVIRQHHFLERHLEHLNTVDLNDVVHAEFLTGHRAPSAAYGLTLQGILFTDSLVLRVIHHALMSRETGPGVPVVKHIADRFFEESRIHIVMNPYRQVGGGIQLMSRLQDQPGKLIGHIVAFQVAAA